MTKVLTEADAAADLAGLPRAVSLPPYIYGGETSEYEKVWTEASVRALVSERDALAGRVAELEAALWGCIAAIERTHHCTEEDRLAAADKARAALSATTPESKP